MMMNVHDAWYLATSAAVWLSSILIRLVAWSTDRLRAIIKRVRRVVASDSFVRVVTVDTESGQVNVEFDCWTMFNIFTAYMFGLQCPSVLSSDIKASDSDKQILLLSVYDGTHDEVFHALINAGKNRQRHWTSEELVDMRRKHTQLFALPMVAVLSLSVLSTREEEINVSPLLNRVLFVDNIVLRDFVRLCSCVGWIDSRACCDSTATLFVFRPDTGTEQTYKSDEHLCF
jgi:hypothetical protein